MTILTTKPAQIINGFNDEVFNSQGEAVQCAEWLENENGDDNVLFVFEKDGSWVVAW